MPKLPIERLDVAILPRPAWLDEQGIDSDVGQPFADGLCGKSEPLSERR